MYCVYNGKVIKLINQTRHTIKVQVYFGARMDQAKKGTKKNQKLDLWPKLKS